MSTRRRRCNSGVSDEGIIAVACGVAILPFVGLFMMCSNDPETKSKGKVFFAIGAIIYAIGIFCN